MEKIQPGKFVEMTYNLSAVENGKQEHVYTTPDESPESIIFGVTEGVFPPLEKALEGKTAGETFDVTIEPAEAFGEYDPARVAHLEKQIFEIDGKFDDEMVTPGAMLPMLNAAGMQMIGRVVEVTPTEVVMDFNHMLAGKTVRFEGKVLSVRDATEEELHPACGCGCGSCGEGDCGCDGEQSCGDGACGCGK